MTAKEIRAYLDAARQVEPPEVRAVLDWERARNAERFLSKDGLVQFHGDVPLTRSTR
jgi:hypothetical protein